VEQVIDHRGHGGGQHAGGHRLAQPPELAPDEQLDGHGHRQNEQSEQRHRTGHDNQRMRQPVARAHEVGLHTGRGGAGPDAGHGQRDDPETGQDTAQQVDRLADAALELILDLDLAGLRCRHATIVSPGRIDAQAAAPPAWMRQPRLPARGWRPGTWSCSFPLAGLKHA
jgi:hypothetical protein